MEVIELLTPSFYRCGNWGIKHGLPKINTNTMWSHEFIIVLCTVSCCSGFRFEHALDSVLASLIDRFLLLVALARHYGISVRCISIPWYWWPRSAGASWGELVHFSLSPSRLHERSREVEWGDYFSALNSTCMDLLRIWPSCASRGTWCWARHPPTPCWLRSCCPLSFLCRMCTLMDRAHQLKLDEGKSQAFALQSGIIPLSSFLPRHVELGKDRIP